MKYVQSAICFVVAILFFYLAHWLVHYEVSLGIHFWWVHPTGLLCIAASILSSAAGALAGAFAWLES